MAIDTQHFKQQLEEEKQQLEEQLQSVGTRNPSHDGDWVPKADEMNVDDADKNEYSDRYESYYTNRGIERPLEQRYNNVKAALERIEQGTYGTCTVCSKQISEERLQANTAAATCIEHADSEQT